MLRILLFLFVAVELLAHAIPALALELTHRIPESVQRLEIRMEYTPSYQEVYGRYEKRVPLREWLFENEATTVSGTVSRSETRIHFDYDWGWMDDWTVSVASAVVHKSQTVNLSGGSGLELPESGSVTGLGDTTISLRKALFASTTWFSVGGMQLVLPTGTAGKAIGHSPNAIGERQTDVGGFFRFTWYPLAPGWRNGLGLRVLSQLKGTRKNYRGERVTYYPGNRREVYYNWSYEVDNLFFGGELKRIEQGPTTLGTSQRNSLFADQGTLEVGFGNLTDLEKHPLPLPWQFRLSWSKYLRARHVPAAPTLGLTLMLFL
jgi:hypothetical protein